MDVISSATMLPNRGASAKPPLEFARAIEVRYKPNTRWAFAAEEQVGGLLVETELIEMGEGTGSV